MILYFADRQLNILGHASTVLPEGPTIVEDLRTEDIETGVSVFECKLPFTAENRLQVSAWAAVGNYILRKGTGGNELYTIIDSEENTKTQTVYVYAEDAGMDLINDVYGEYEADKAYPITHYINMFSAGSGFQIGINEVPNLTRKLSWDGDATATERIASVATQFDGCEVSYTFDVDGLFVVAKYINIYKKRGQDIGVELRLNRDVDSIVTTKSISNLATALQCVGGTPEQEEDTDEEPVPITLAGYKYDDGDFYVDGTVLKSREALKKWNRYLWRTDSAGETGGHITKQFSYDTVSQSTLCAHAITELKAICDTEVNYEVDLKKLPDNVSIGDRVNIVDDSGELYLSTRVLKLEVSETEQTQTAILGEHLLRDSGISQKVLDLATQFAQLAVTAARSVAISNAAKQAAANAQTQADTALSDAAAAQNAANDAQAAANSASASAVAAQQAADNAQSAVAGVEESVSGLQQSVANAQAAAEQARQAAETADAKAVEAQQAAANAQTKANEAAGAAGTAQETANSAAGKADAAQNTADQAVEDAEKASTTAAAAKQDAEQAQQDIAGLGKNLTTLSNTMQADYARKTDLTEATASLQTQITQNAAEISSTTTKVQEIDETANDAAEQAQSAQNAAQNAQNTANQATADAQAAQTAADNAASAAASAQSEADAAKAAASTAQGVADKAKEDLEAAKADLATVTGRVGATEEEIAAAQQAVNAAQAAADKAQADAEEAAGKAVTAQNTANTAVENASAAQRAADDAADKADLAQQAANAAQGDATAAQQAATAAQEAATAAQNTANTAKTNAETAQSTADNAAAAAQAAQSAADDADAKAAQAAADLETAIQNLANVTSRVGATEEEVEAAQAAVVTAQAAADKAKEDAAAAQSTADTAKANAATAQTAADNAKTAADNAQAAADEAQSAADKAQEDVNALAVRVTTAETNITQNAEQIALRATKTEVAQTLGGYYTKSEADAALSIKADEISQTVSNTYTTKDEFNALEVGGRNLLRYTETLPIVDSVRSEAAISRYTTSNQLVATDDGIKFSFCANAACSLCVPLVYDGCIDNGETLTLSFDYRGNITDPGTIYFEQRTGANRFKVLGDITTLKANETAWQHYSVTFSISNINSGQNYRILMFYNLAKYTADNWIEIRARSLKLEKGTIATGWTPAPEEHHVEFGSRNRLQKTDASKYVEEWLKLTAADSLSVLDNGFLKVTPVGTAQRSGAYPPKVSTLENATEYTLSFEAYADAELTINYIYIMGSSGNKNIAGSALLTTEPKKYAITWTTIADYVGCSVMLGVDAGTGKTVTTPYYIKNLQVEKGNRATDWTPAPEDVDESIAAVSNQQTSIVSDCTNIIMTALESYVRTSDYDEFKQTVETQLNIMADEITMNFTTTTEQVAEIDGDLQSKFTQLYKHIKFSGETAISINSGDSTITLELDNESGIVFKRNGVQFGLWDGDNFYTGNIIIRLTERLQLGGFGYVPRTDGSLSFLWLGEV